MIGISMGFPHQTPGKVDPAAHVSFRRFRTRKWVRPNGFGWAKPVKEFGA